MTRQQIEAYILNLEWSVTKRNVLTEIFSKFGSIENMLNILHEAEQPKQIRVDTPRRRAIKLLCINAGFLEYEYYDGFNDESYADNDKNEPVLDFCSVYTSPGPVVDKRGSILYPINELGGAEMYAQRFVPLKCSRKKS